MNSKKFSKQTDPKAVINHSLSAITELLRLEANFATAIPYIHNIHLFW